MHFEVISSSGPDRQHKAALSRLELVGDDAPVGGVALRCIRSNLAQ